MQGRPKAEWQELIEAYLESRQSQTEWCKVNKVNMLQTVRLTSSLILIILTMIEHYAV